MPELELELWQAGSVEMPPRTEVVTQCHHASKFLDFHFGTFLRLRTIGPAGLGGNLHHPPKRLKILAVSFLDP